MRVYSKDLYEEVTEAAAVGALQAEYDLSKAHQQRPTSQPLNRTLSRTARASLAKTQKASKRERDAAQRKQRLQKSWEATERQTQENLRKARERNHRRKEAEEAKFRQMLAKMDAETEFTDQIGEYLDFKDQSNNRNKQSLYKEWCKTVYHPIRRDIQSKLDQIPTSEIEARRRKAFEEYLDTVNRKEGVFRDIIIESDYDPLKHRSSTLTYNRTKYDKVDPLHKDVTQIDKEGKLIAALDPNFQHIRHRPRECLDLELWDKLESTPYIRYADSENEVLHKIPVPGNRAAETVVHLGQYDISRDPVLRKQQFFPGGKRIIHRPLRKDNIVYHHNTPYTGPSQLRPAMV